MKNWTLFPGATRALFVLAAGAVFTPAHAQDGGGIAPLTTAPSSSFSLGAGFASGNEKDRARFGMFNGLRKDDINGLFGFGYYNRDAAAGKWLSIEGRNLGLDNREFGVSYRWLGDMKVNFDYGELVRHDPRTINTSLSGSGTTTPTVSLLTVPGTGSELNLELKRKGLGVAFEKQFGNFQFEASFKNEDKTGARFFGKGFACGASYNTAGVNAVGNSCGASTLTSLLMVPEPIDSTIRQFEAKLNWSGEKLKLSGGYYGNFYTNNNGSLTPTVLGNTIGNLNGGTLALDNNMRNILQLPMALWPDSEAHQFFIGGNYAFTPSTKLNFKYSYTHATQKESFGGMGLTGGPAGRGDLGGELNTTKAQLGFSSHPLDKLHLHGDVGYFSRENKTPVDIYNTHTQTVTPAGVATWSNSAMSPSKFDAKFEANYKLPYNLLVVGGVKYERENTGAWTPSDVAGGISLLRQTTETKSSRLELKKTMSDTFTGSVAFLDERRSGDSPWLRPVALPLTGVISAVDNCAAGGGITAFPTSGQNCAYSRTNQIAYTQKDLQRQKWRLKGDWQPTERLMLQGFIDYGNDDLRGPTTSGLSNTKMRNYTLDAAFDVSENWKLNGYYTYSEQSLLMGHSADYDGRVKDSNNTFGIGFTGTPLANFRIGGDLISLYDTLKYTMTPDELISGPNLTLLGQTGGLPDVKYKLTRVKLYGEYALSKPSTLRFDYIYNRTYFNEWTYDGNNGKPFLYSDNTTLTAKQTQSVNFIGLSYIHKFQ